MKIIRNNIIPFPGYKAVNLFGVLFVRKNAVIGETLINHEEIHTTQMKEMLYIFFYIWYGIEWFIRLLILWNAHEAYESIGFEREADIHKNNMQYLESRKLFAWIKYV